MNTRYIIAMGLVLVVGGFFTVRSMTSSVPLAPIVEEQKEVFGEGSTVVGTLSTTTAGSQIPGMGTDTSRSMKVVTVAELASHNTQANCWVAYNGTGTDFVYDITSWLPRHPGSAAAIAPFCGTAEEFTAAFSRKHGTSKVGKLEKEGVVQGVLK